MLTRVDPGSACPRLRVNSKTHGLGIVPDRAGSGAGAVSPGVARRIRPDPLARQPSGALPLPPPGIHVARAGLVAVQPSPPDGAATRRPTGPGRSSRCRDPHWITFMFQVFLRPAWRTALHPGRQRLGACLRYRRHRGALASDGELGSPPCAPGLRARLKLSVRAGSVRRFGARRPGGRDRTAPDGGAGQAWPPSSSRCATASRSSGRSCSSTRPSAPPACIGSTPRWCLP
jgi:hypothetical protein